MLMFLTTKALDIERESAMTLQTLILEAEQCE